MKKQSSSLRRLMVRLLLVEAITSFTVARTKLMELCWEQALGSHGCGDSALLPLWLGVPVTSPTSRNLTKRLLKLSS